MTNRIKSIEIIFHTTGNKNVYVYRKDGSCRTYRKVTEKNISMLGKYLYWNDRIFKLRNTKTNFTLATPIFTYDRIWKDQIKWITQ